MRRSRPWAKPWQTAMPLAILLLVGSWSALLADDTVTNAPPVEAGLSSTNTVPPSSRTTRSRPVGVVAFALIGTASYPGGEVAFFDGSREEFKTSVHPGEKIGDWIVAVIAFDHVRLTSGTNQFDLPMDKQLRRENTGEWQIQPQTARFNQTGNPRAEQSRSAPEAGSDRRRSPTQFSDAGSGTRPAGTNRRTGNRTNRGGTQPGQ